MKYAGADRIARFARLVETGKFAPAKTPVQLGVDLGTANIVLAVTADDKPIAGRQVHSTVVRDGIVVDWHGAVQAVTGLRRSLQDDLGVTFDSAAVAIPPGIDEATVKIFGNVCEAAGMSVREFVDEPVAAARALGISDGAVIDLGHGTTGVSVLEGGRVVSSIDEPTGGHHMTLVISGALGISYEEAEAFKRDTSQPDMVFGLVRPTLERMATIAHAALADAGDCEVFLVGGASSFPQAGDLFESILGRTVTQSVSPLFPTPLGTAMRSRND